LLVLIFSNNFYFFDEPTKSIPHVNSLLAPYASFLACMTLAFSYEYWSQSTATDTFIFTVLLLTLALYLLYKSILYKKQLFEIHKKERTYKYMDVFSQHYYIWLAILAALLVWWMQINFTLNRPIIASVPVKLFHQHYTRTCYGDRSDYCICYAVHSLCGLVLSLDYY
ncbi:MAG: hypothetical protein ACREHC_01105, partial [Candidatus Levyibacteriota bacterium]